MELSLMPPSNKLSSQADQGCGAKLHRHLQCEGGWRHAEPHSHQCKWHGGTAPKVILPSPPDSRGPSPRTLARMLGATIHKKSNPPHTQTYQGRAEDASKPGEGNAAALYLHEANCCFGFIGGLERWCISKTEAPQLPVPGQSCRASSRGSLLTQKLAKQELLENMLASGD